MGVKQFQMMTRVLAHLGSTNTSNVKLYRVRLTCHTHVSDTIPLFSSTFQNIFCLCLF